MAPRKAAPPLPPLPTPGVPVSVRLQHVRTEHRLSQLELARLAGIKQDTISRLECGYTRLPQRRTLARLAAAFGLTEAAFCRELGMHGALRRPAGIDRPAPAAVASSRARQVAVLFDQLTPAQQQYLEGLLLLWTAGGSPDIREQGDTHA